MTHAAELAALFEGALTGLHVCPPPLYMIPAYGSPDLLAVITMSMQDTVRQTRGSEQAFIA